jgi:hypothetical protein
LFTGRKPERNASIPLQPHHGATGVAVRLLIFVIMAREVNAARMAAFGALVAVKD